MEKLRVGIVFGGKSAEHEVSLQSAKNIVDAIDKSRFDVVLLGIDKQGQWHVSDASNYLLNADDLPILRCALRRPALRRCQVNMSISLSTHKTVSRCRRWMSFSRLSTVRWAKMFLAGNAAGRQFTVCRF